MQELTCCDPLVLEGQEWLPSSDMRWSGFTFWVPALRNSLEREIRNRHAPVPRVSELLERIHWRIIVRMESTFYIDYSKFSKCSGLCSVVPAKATDICPDLAPRLD